MHGNTVLATLVYITKDEQTLMIHRNRKENDLHEGKYNGLGGKVEEDESPLDCAIREVKEESSLKVKNIIFKGHILFPEFDKEGRNWMVFVYRVDQFSGDVVKENREGDLLWIDNSEVEKLNLWEGDSLFIPYIHTDATFDGVIYYKNGVVDRDRELFLNVRSKEGELLKKISRHDL